MVMQRGRLGLVVAGLALMATAGPVGAGGIPSAPDPVCANGTCTVTIGYTGSMVRWTAPAGVTSVHFSVVGAAGGTSTEGVNAGGLGGRITGTLAVTPGAAYFVSVGGQGPTADASALGTLFPGGFNGGGGSWVNFNGFFPGTGGGASDIQITPSTPTTPADYLVVAGGGGGGGYGGVGGNGGGLIGQDGNESGVFPTSIGYGGTQSAGGATGNGPCVTPVNGPGTPGTLGVGGNGEGCLAAAGGGGGGFYGGGGASGTNEAGGGGGGSSYADPTATSDVVNTQGFADATGNGSIVLTYSVVVPTTLAPSTSTTTTAAATTTLAVTGSNLVVLAGGGLVLVGAGALLAGRRRRGVRA